MKNVPTLILAFLSILLVCQHANAQTHKSYISRGNESLPMNRAAFIFCYNNATYTNPAVAILNNKKHNTGTPTETKSTSDHSKENICMFPNLTEDELWVQLDTKTIAEENVQVEIYNAFGERVYASKIEQSLHKINVCDFTAGTFLVKLGDNVQKMIIE